MKVASIIGDFFSGNSLLFTIAHLQLFRSAAVDEAWDPKEYVLIAGNHELAWRRMRSCWLVAKTDGVTRGRAGMAG